MVGGALLVEHSSYGYTGAVAVHPTRPDTVVVGYTRGPYVSNDGGDTFTPTDRNATHDDKHAYHFTPSGRLYEANDGGVVYTDDLGARLRSEFNRSLANLQFLGPSARDWWGRTTASYQHPGLIGGGLQDNSDVYCQRWPNGSTTPWRRLPEWMFDGQAIMFLRDGSALFSYGDVRVARWEAPALIAEPSPIPIRINRPGVTQPGNGLASGPYAIVNDPQWRNADGHLMFAAIVSNGRDLYGLFAADDGSDKHWNYLTTMPFAEGSLASAVSSGSGVSVLVGVRGRGEIWRVDLRSGVERTVSTGLPSTTDFSSCVLDIVIQDESPWDAYAVWYDHAGHGALYHTTDGGSWSPLGGLPDENLFCIATDWTVSPKTLFVATDSRVYVSRNEGRDWTDESIGLPARSHCSDLAFVTQPDGARFLHLSTFGWSTWVTQLV
jgi:hypothetical protein